MTLPLEFFRVLDLSRALSGLVVHLVERDAL